MTIDFLNRVWSIEIKSRKDIDYNGKLNVKVVVGKNRMFYANMHVNPASNKMINFLPFEINRQTLREESHIIKELLAEFMLRTDYLHKFDRQNHVTIDNQEPQDYQDLANLTLAHFGIKNKISVSNTSLQEFHITTDIPCKKPKLVVKALEYFTDEIFSEIYLNQSVKDELQLRNDVYFSKSSQNSGIAIVNFARSNADIIYAKGYNQTANKIKRVSNKNDISSNELQHLRDNFSHTESSIRVETQLKNPQAIHDIFNYRKHETMVEIIELVIKKIEETVVHENPTVEVQQFVKALDDYQIEFAKPLKMFKSLIYENIRLLNKYKVPDPPPDILLTN